MSHGGLARALGVLAVAAMLAACSGSVTSSPAGRAIVQAASSTVAVDDSVQLTAGVLYDDGRFVEFESATITSSASTVATYDPATRWLHGLAVGTTRIAVTIPQVASFDTLFAVVASAR